MEVSLKILSEDHLRHWIGITVATMPKNRPASVTPSKQKIAQSKAQFL